MLATDLHRERMDLMYKMNEVNVPNESRNFTQFQNVGDFCVFYEVYLCT